MRVGWVFSAIFDQYVVISRKRCILDTKLLWDGNRKPYAGYRMVSVSGFKVTVVSKGEYLQSDAFYRHSYYIGRNRTPQARYRQATQLQLTTPLLLRKPCKLFASVVRVCQLGFSFYAGSQCQSICSAMFISIVTFGAHCIIFGQHCMYVCMYVCYSPLFTFRFLSAVNVYFRLQVCIVCLCLGSRNQFSQTGRAKSQQPGPK